MRRTSEWKGLKTVAARLLGSLVLVALLPFSAAAVEYTPLAAVKSGKYPVDVASSASGTFYVIDGIERTIRVFDSSYNPGAKFSSVGLPTAIAVSGDSIYVGDTFSKSVQILNSTGTIVGDLKKAGTTAQFRLISNIAVDASGLIYVVDKFANTIEVFDAAGNYSYTITGFTMPQDAVVVGTELFIIDFPYQADTLDPTGSTQQASADVQLSRVQIFDLVTQTFVVDETRTFPGNGWDTTLGQYINLKSIAADSQNNIYLADSYQNTLYKFDSNGQFLGTIAEQVKIPLGATVSQDGRLMVTSSRDGKLKVLGVDYLAGLATWLNGAPYADAGADQVVDEETIFVLDASGSQDEDGISSYFWTQVEGTPVLPSNPFETDSPQLSLTAPSTDYAGTVLTFELTVADGYGKESGTSTTTVEIKNVISGSVVIDDGALYTNNQLVTLTFDVPEAVDYRIANDSDPFNGGYQGYTTTTFWTLSDYDPATPANTKTVRVEFRDAGGNTTSSSNTILLDMQAPAAPGSIDTSGAAGDLAWDPVADAVSYTLEYAFSSDFSDAVTLTDLTNNELTISLEGLEYGTWYWRVASTDAAGNTSDWSEVGTFIHIRPNDPPVADAGSNQTVSENGTFSLDASGSTDDKGIASYTWIQITGTPVLTEDPFITVNPTVEITSPVVGPLGETLSFELIVTDIFGLTDMATTEVMVHNVISGTLAINAGAEITNNPQVAITLDAPEAAEMRLANDAEPFGDTYIVYNANLAWTLSEYDPATPQNIKTVRVEFRDEGGNTAVASSTILLDMEPPAVPIIDPNGSAGDFNWAPVADAVSYTLEYAYSSDFSVELTTLSGLDYNGVTVSLDDFDHVNNYGTWYWRVRSIDAAGNASTWSEIDTFHIEADCSVIIPEMPQLLWPAAGATEISRTPFLEINGIVYPEECGFSYLTEWQVSQTADFSTLILHVSTQNNMIMYQVPTLALDPETTYYWRAKQRATSGMNSVWSEAWSFTTAADYDVLGVDGIILDETTRDKHGTYSLKQIVGDSDIKLNSIDVSEGTVPLLIKDLDPSAITEMINRPSAFNYGLLSYRIAVEPGATAQLVLNYSEEAPNGGNQVNYVYTHEYGWHPNSNVLYLEEYRSITITWTDGGLGDADGVVNGIIINP